MTNPNPIEDPDVCTVPILYKRFTNPVTQSVLLNTKLNLFVQPNLFRTCVKVRALYFLYGQSIPVSKWFIMQDLLFGRDSHVYKSFVQYESAQK